MSDEQAPEPEKLTDAITACIMDWCSRNGGFPVSLVAALDYLDGEGDSRLLATTMENQPIQRSMGLASYLDEYYRDDARSIWRGLEMEWEAEDE